MQHFGTLGRIPSVEGAVASLDGLAIPVTEPLEEAYRALLPTLVRRLALIVRDVDEAQDLAQQTFLRATETWPPSKGQPAGAWLTTVGVRLAIDAVRRRKRWGFLPLRESDATWALTVDPDVWRALGTLDVRTRAALVLTVLDGYTQAEVAGRQPVSDEFDQRLRQRLNALSEAVPAQRQRNRVQPTNVTTRAAVGGGGLLLAGLLVVVALRLGAQWSIGTSQSPSPAPTVSAGPTESPAGLAAAPPLGISEALAVQLARQHVSSDSVFVSASSGRFADVNHYAKMGSRGPKQANQQVWAVDFESLYTICPPGGSACYSPRPRFTTVILDEFTGDWITTFSY